MADAPSSKSGLGPTHVLIVEDDEQLARLIGRWVKEHYGDDAEVHLANSVEGGSERIADLSEIDVVLLDRHFPSGTGVDLLDQLYDRFDPIVVMITAVDPTTELIRFPVADYLVKPIDRPGLIKRLALLDKLNTSGALDAYSDARKASLLEYHLDDPDADPLFRRFAARWTYDRIEVAAGSEAVYVYELYTNAGVGVDISVAGILDGDLETLVADATLRPVGEVIPSGNGYAWVDVDRQDAIDPPSDGFVIYAFQHEIPEEFVTTSHVEDASAIEDALEDAYR